VGGCHSLWIWHLSWIVLHQILLITSQVV
jgi:hypothetical protein